MVWQKYFAMIMFSTALVGCQEHLSGTYTDSGGMSSFTFDGDKVYYGVLGKESQGGYERDKDRVKVRLPGREALVLRLDDDGILHGPQGVTWERGED